MRIILIFLFVGFAQAASAQLLLQGRVVSLPDSSALAGAVIKVKGMNQGATTDESGRFTLSVDQAMPSLQISYIGFESLELSLQMPVSSPVTIGLRPDANQLGEVVISTGFEKIPKERATGSFATVDNALLNRRVSTDIVSRLDDVAAGLINNRGKGSAQGLLIRGQSTINSSTRPLIIIDNFPYEGDLNSINPNDIENVTVLKDAAAASIWGSRAGNGVIVLTTKKGSASKSPQITINSNVTIAARPDMFYQPRMSTADYIDNERFLFESGRYNSAERNAAKYPFTPVVELLMAQRDKLITQEQAQAEIDLLKSRDIRNEYGKYMYQRSVSQQYSVSVNGGGDTHRYFVSAGFDKNRPSEVSNTYQRFTVNANNSFHISPKLEVSAGLYFSESKNRNGNPGPLVYTNPLTGSLVTQMYPYASLAAENGDPLAVIKDYRLSFLQQAQTAGLLDWHYRPLAEMATADNTTRLTDYRINLTADYKLFSGLSLSMLYQYGKGISSTMNHFSEHSYTARTLVNQLSSVDSNGVVKQNLAPGGILDRNENAYTSHNLRGQLHYSHNFGSSGELVAIAGAELRDYSTQGGTSRYYGYNDSYASARPVDYITAYRSYVNPASTMRVPYMDSRSGSSDRYLSYFVNGSYTLKGKYILSASGRMDQSNLFGVETNDKRVPLYSAGVAWRLSQERFFQLGWLSSLKLRSTFGYSGNSNKNVSAFTTAFFEGTDYYTREPYAIITNPPNERLRWEKVQTLNLGLDFETRGRRLTGSIEYYFKKGIDLIGSMPYPGSSGVKTFTGNYASTAGRGLDMTLTAKIFDKSFKWQSDLLLSHTTDKVTRYEVRALATAYLGNADGTSVYPLQGRPLYALYSLEWAGLDPSTGDPQGYLNGEVSKDYLAILRTDPDKLHYHGPARPTTFGAFRNTFSYKSFGLSFNLSYRLGHYFRQRSVSYTDVNNSVVTHSDYGLRWQKAGDELLGSVPSRPSAVDANRDGFYAYSQILVQKADNIRLQDITLSYDLTRNASANLPFRNARLYVYANNIAKIWKAYKGSLDPDYAQAMYAPAKSISVGIKVDL
jgi:TonB-linked SusC/RagA family outer membrane protein